jgi:hypothetical protein
MSKKVNYVYKTTDPITGEFYIGKHCGYIDDKYKGSGNWVIKHEDKSRLVKEILAKDISDEYAMHIESIYIEMNWQNKLNRNLSIGCRIVNKKISESDKEDYYDYRYYLDEFERMVQDMKEAQTDIVKANEMFHEEMRKKEIQEEILKKQSVKMKFQPSRELSKLLYL